MKIIKSSLKQTSFSCPSAWAGQLEDGTQIEITFRTGRLQLKTGDKNLLRGERDQFDVSSYMELDEALAILAKGGVGSE